MGRDVFWGKGLNIPSAIWPWIKTLEAVYQHSCQMDQNRCFIPLNFGISAPNPLMKSIQIPMLVDLEGYQR